MKWRACMWSMCGAKREKKKTNKTYTQKYNEICIESVKEGKKDLSTHLNACAIPYHYRQIMEVFVQC